MTSPKHITTGDLLEITYIFKISRFSRSLLSVRIDNKTRTHMRVKIFTQVDDIKTWIHTRLDIVILIHVWSTRTQGH